MPGDAAIDADIKGLDRLELPRSEPVRRTARAWAVLWPKIAAVGIGLGLWQLVVITGWQPTYVIPPPSEVFAVLGEEITTAAFWEAVMITLQRAAVGFAIAVVVGSAVGLAVSQSAVLRSAVGSFITGLQSMPSIVWFPFAILLFGLSETAILFVVILGAAPAIANGLIAGIDHIPPILLRVGKVLGATGPTSWFRVVLPAAMPSYVAGLKQGWSFAWRSLMAGELLVIIAARPSIGVRLQFARELSDAAELIAMMIVVLAIGLIVDGVLFGTIERRVRRNRGLVGAK